MRREHRQLMDINELAAYLRLKKQTIYNWLHEGKISGIKVGGVWRFDKAVIDQWLLERTVDKRTQPSRRSALVHS